MESNSLLVVLQCSENIVVPLKGFLRVNYCPLIFNNYLPKAKLILLINPRDEVDGIIQQY